MQDKPANLPTTQPNGEPLKALTEVLLDRRATNHFADGEVPEEAEVIPLLAIGRASGGEKAYPGRFEPERIVFSERYGEMWKSK